jgi:hypothetical protein
MTKPDVTLQPSKGVITQAAAQIYAAYVAVGRVEDENADQWIKQAIRDAIGIARTVDASVQSDEELPDQGEQPLRESSMESGLPADSSEGTLFRTKENEDSS